MATIYDINTGATITAGLQGADVCDAALRAARRIAAENRETVILEDDDGEWLVGPRGGLRRFTKRLKLKYGFSPDRNEERP